MTVKNIDLSNVFYFISGFPTQTEEETKDDFEAIKNMKDTIVIVHDFWLEPGTDIANRPGHYGITDVMPICLVKNDKGKLWSASLDFKMDNKVKPRKLEVNKHVYNLLPSAL